MKNMKDCLALLSRGIIGFRHLLLFIEGINCSFFVALFSEDSRAV